MTWQHDSSLSIATCHNREETLRLPPRPRGLRLPFHHMDGCSNLYRNVLDSSESVGFTEMKNVRAAVISFLQYLEPLPSKVIRLRS